MYRADGMVRRKAATENTSEYFRKELSWEANEFVSMIPEILARNFRVLVCVISSSSDWAGVSRLGNSRFQTKRGPRGTIAVFGKVPEILGDYA